MKSARLEHERLLCNEPRKVAAALEQRAARGVAPLGRHAPRAARQQHARLLERLAHRAGDERGRLAVEPVHGHVAVGAAHAPARKRVEAAEELQSIRAAHPVRLEPVGLVAPAGCGAAVEHDGGGEGDAGCGRGG